MVTSETQKRDNAVRCFLANLLGNVVPDQMSGMRASYRRFLRLFLVCILALLTVDNFVFYSPKDERNVAKQQWRDRRKQRHKEKTERIQRRRWRKIELRRIRQELKNQSLTALVAQDDDPCDKDALPAGSFHIVVAAWKYQESEGNTGFEHNLNYLVNLGLPNAQIFWYRREKLNIMARNYTASTCNISVQEVLTPNTGRDALPFFHHILETWENPPKAIVMLHGHVANSWHTSCQGVFARTIYYYRSLVLNASSSKPMISLVSEPYSTKYFDHTRSGPNYDHLRNSSSSSRRRQLLLKKSADESVADKVPAIVVHRRLENNDNHTSSPPSQNPCQAFHARWKDVIDAQRSKVVGKRHNCCGTFIVPWNRIRRFPKEFYEDIVKNVILDSNYSDYFKGRHCYEFVVWKWFGDYQDDFTDKEITNVYEQADGLIHGDVMQRDPAVLFRLKQCYATQGLTQSHRSGWLTLDWWNKWLG